MMKKDKLITIRVSKETRDKFNQWCEVNDIKGSSFLSDIINGCIDGSISAKFASQSIDNIASHKIAELENTVNSLYSQLNSLEKGLYDKLDESIDESVSQKIVELEDKVSSLSSQLESIDDKSEQKISGLDDRVSNLESLYNSIDERIEEPIIVETETAQLEDVEEKATIIPETEKKVVTGYSRRVKSKEYAIASKDEPPQELIDIPRGEEISQRKLAEITKNGKGTMSRWANVAKSRPKWFDEYIKVKTKTRKGKSVKVMYRR